MQDVMQPKGMDFVRLAIAMALGKDGVKQAGILATQRWGEDSMPARIMKAGGPALLATKAEVPAGATGGANWAAELIDLESASTEFFALVRERSLIGRIEGLRRIPLRTRLVNAVSGFSAAWVGEGKAKPVSSATYDENTLPSRKIVSLAVVTNELIESADPAAEQLIHTDMVNAMVAALDQSFIDPVNTGEAGVEPAAVTNGAASEDVVGTGDVDDFRQSISYLAGQFGGDLTRAVLIGRPELFVHIANQPFRFPSLGARGGELVGIPAFATKALPIVGGLQQLVLLDADSIAIGEGEMDLRVSRQGTIEMLDSSLTGDSVGVVPGTAASTVSLFQTNSTAILYEKRINWQVARPGGVAVLTGLDYGGIS